MLLKTPKGQFTYHPGIHNLNRFAQDYAIDYWRQFETQIWFEDLLEFFGGYSLKKKTIMLYALQYALIKKI